MKKTMKKSVALLLVLVLSLSFGACGNQPEEEPETTAGEPEIQITPDPVADNYRTFYQIFVGSFSDSNRDGIGDLRGIIERMDYLNDGDIHSETSLGVQGIWLSPIFSSPSYHKYDTTDYYEIDWRFGTEEDLKELIELCHQRNVKVILDLAINHTSSRHEWFVKFKEARLAGDESDPYYNYYSCVSTAEKAAGITYQKLPNVDCWYECNFSGDMPELNYDNPEVRQEMLNVAKYYLDLGVDGFRFDAVKYIYYGDTARSVEFWSWYMDELREICPDIYCVGECWSGETEIVEYYSAMNCFNFAMAQAEGAVAEAAKGGNITKYTSYIDAFQEKIQGKNPDSMVMGFLSNHDMDRIAGSFILEGNMRMAANLYLLAPGSPVIYYGEEIGMRGSRGSESTDANRRLAMLWGDGDLVSNPTGSTYGEDKQIDSTVSQQMEDADSLYRYYCRLLSLRHSYPEIARGDYQSLQCGEKNFGGFRIDGEERTLILLHNTSTEEITYDLSECGDLDGFLPGEICAAIGMGDATLEGTVLTLGPQTSVILK